MTTSAWVGPAIVAAFISAVITAFGWYASHVSSRRLDSTRRRERIQDVQTAIRAEIRSHRERLRLFALLDVEVVAGRIRSSQTVDGFTPFVPKEVSSFVFDAVVGEIHLPPTHAIDPIVYYYRQIATLAQFAEDLRSERYLTLDASRKIEMYEDYIALGVKALQLAEEALRAIEDGGD